MAGAATLGYAVGGVLALRAMFVEQMRVQNAAAITFNGLSILAALLYVAGGGKSLVGLLIHVAAAFFTIALGYFQARMQ